MTNKKYSHHSFSTDKKVVSICITDNSTPDIHQVFIEYDPSDKQNIRINCRRIPIIGMNPDINNLPEELKPGCFGAFGLPSCNIPGCLWFARCKQSREDC